jgi:DNA repair protein RadA/Sms
MPPAFACTTCGQTYDAYRVRCVGCDACTIKRVDTRPDAPHAADSAEPPDFDGEPTLVPLSDIVPETLERMPCGIAGVDAIFGGGVVLRKAVILASPPGIGKTTIALQIADGVRRKVLFVSAEMPPRALSALGARMELSMQRIYPVQLTELSEIERTIAKLRPAMVVIDSIQEIESDRYGGRAGSPVQVVECCKRLVKLSEVQGFALWMIGHVTADDRMAGPRTLEHAVDAVLELDGVRTHPRRILRAGKNRMAVEVDARCMFTMTALGLVPRDEPDYDADELTPDPELEPHDPSPGEN